MIGTTTTGVFLPLPESVHRMFTDLLGKQVVVKKATPFVVGPATLGIVAAYVHDSGQIGALAVCDLAWACHGGAALMLLPPSTSADAVKSGKFTETIVDNIREVLNVAASLFIHEERPHVRLREIHILPGKLPEAVAKVLQRPAARMDLELTVQGYGAGRMTLLTAP